MTTYSVLVWITQMIRISKKIWLLLHLLIIFKCKNVTPKSVSKYQFDFFEYKVKNKAHNQIPLLIEHVFNLNYNVSWF